MVCMLMPSDTHFCVHGNHEMYFRGGKKENTGIARSDREFFFLKKSGFELIHGKNVVRKQCSVLDLSLG